MNYITFINPNDFKQNQGTPLQVKFGEQGIEIPSLTAAEIAQLTDAPDFTLIGDSTNNVLKVKLAGSFVTIVTM